MTLAELRNKPPPDFLRKLTQSEYELLWHADFWDGPISGVLAMEGKEYWFEMIQESEDAGPAKWYRRYAVVFLTQEQLAFEHEVHDAFRLHVGTHTDYGKSEAHVVRPQEQHHLFYDRYLEYCRANNFESNEAIAWF